MFSVELSCQVYNLHVRILTGFHLSLCLIEMKLYDTVILCLRASFMLQTSYGYTIVMKTCL
jgi:hypothetical protein